jgi:Lipase (class 3)
MNIHSGFLSHLEDLSDEAFEAAYRIIQNLSSQRTDKTLEIMGTGHSLGGALATLFTAAAKQMADSIGIKVNARGVTFGAPNTVHGGSVDKMNELFGGPGNWVRFEQSLDPVPLAVFWKDSPGVAIRYKGAIFVDTANAFQIFGQNPHGSSNYYHSIETHMTEWKASISPLTLLVNQKEGILKKISDLKKQANDALSEINKDMSKIQDIDLKHSGQLFEFRSRLLELLKDREEASKKKLEEEQKKAQEILSDKERGQILTPDYIASIKEKLQEALSEHRISSFLRAELESNNIWEKHATEENAKLLESLKALLDKK